MDQPNDTFNGVEYTFGRIPAMTQFHLTRRLAPVITRMSTVDFAALQQSRPSADGQEPSTLGRILDLMQPIADALHQLSDADCEYVVNACMSHVKRRQGDVFVSVWNKASNSPMFNDIDLPLMLQLTVRSLMENLSGFLPAPAPSSGRAGG